MEGRDLVAGSQSIELHHFRDAYPRYNVRLETIGITAEDRQCWIDMTPFMHPSPHRVPLNASLPFIFRLFRGLGLRFLFVVDDDNRVRFTSFFILPPLSICSFILLVGERYYYSQRRCPIQGGATQIRLSRQRSLHFSACSSLMIPVI